MAQSKLSPACRFSGPQESLEQVLELEAAAEDARFLEGAARREALEGLDEAVRLVASRKRSTAQGPPSTRVVSTPSTRSSQKHNADMKMRPPQASCGKRMASTAPSGVRRRRRVLLVPKSRPIDTRLVREAGMGRRA